MQVDSITTAGIHPVAPTPATAPPPANGVREVGQSPAHHEGLPAPGQSVAPWPEMPVPQQSTSFLTVDMVRDELMTMGVEPSNDNVAIAQSMAKLGLALTPQTMAEAHATLSAAGSGVLPPSFALAKVLNLPSSPAVLRGLSSVMAASSTAAQSHGSIFSMLQAVLPAALAPQASLPVDAVIEPAEVTVRRELPRELLQRLGLTIEFGATPAEIATKMQAYSRQVLRSTESRIAQALSQEGALDEINDLRALLLGLAKDSPDAEVREGAAALASHIEGQQLINLSGMHGHRVDSSANMIAYVAVPFALAGEQTLVEMRLWPKAEDRPESWTDEEAYPIRATVRLTLSHLGRVQADIMGDLAGYLQCRLSAEKPAVLQLISRNTGQLSDLLARAGWTRNEIACEKRADWSPLWTGGEALAKPRQRIDWRA